MKFVWFVLFPAFIQVLIGAAVMFAHRPGGEFVGLGVMLMGMVAIPVTALFNAMRLKTQPPMPMLRLINLTFYTSLVFPVLSIALYLLAS